MAIQQHRFSSAQTETVDVARIRHFTYNAVTNTLTITWQAGEISGSVFVNRRNGNVTIPSEVLDTHPNVVADLESLVTRMLTYLENEGIIPSGTQEAIT